MTENPYPVSYLSEQDNISKGYGWQEGYQAGLKDSKVFINGDEYNFTNIPECDKGCIQCAKTNYQAGVKKALELFVQRMLPIYHNSTIAPTVIMVKAECLESLKKELLEGKE